MSLARLEKSKAFHLSFVYQRGQGVGRKGTKELDTGGMTTGSSM